MSKQTRLERFFVAAFQPAPNRVTLLDLPFNIRRRIYDYIEFPEDTSLFLNIEERGKDEVYRPKYSKHDVHLSISQDCLYNCTCCMRHLLDCFQLMYVCRALYQDMSSIVYGRNYFTVSRSLPGGLDALLKLTPTSLRMLRYLTIRLNQCWSICESLGWCIHDESGKSKCCNKDHVLDCHHRSGKRIIRDWEVFCKRIAPYLRPSALNLCLICDTANAKTAHEVLEPLATFPVLRSCSIRLSSMRDPVLHRLAGTTASRLTSRSDSTPVFFRFTTLPEEIQIRILEHTDLVAPQDLEWTHESRLFGFTPNSRLLCRSALDRGMATREAQVFPVLENLNPCVTCTGGYGFPLVGEDRSCAQSNQCGCWVFPQALFSLCRKLRREAIRIFYSENHFIIHYQGDWKVGDLKLPHLSFLAFCKSQGAVPWLRSIQFELPCMATYKVLSTHRYNGYKIMTEWDDDINFLASEADLSRLTVTIGLFETHTNYRPDDQGSWISSLQKQRISDKLTKLHGLKDLFVHLSYFPIHLEPVMELERREKELEQKVMGDNYNAVARGKFSVSGRRHVQPDKYYFD